MRVSHPIDYGSQFICITRVGALHRSRIWLWITPQRRLQWKSCRPHPSKCGSILGTRQCWCSASCASSERLLTAVVIIRQKVLKQKILKLLCQESEDGKSPKSPTEARNMMWFYILKQHCGVFLPLNDIFKIVFTIHRLVKGRMAPLLLTQRPCLARYRILVACPAPSGEGIQMPCFMAMLHTPTSTPPARC